MIGAVTKQIQIYGLRVGNIKGDFVLETEVTKIDRSELLTLGNPKYKEMISKYPTWIWRPGEPIAEKTRFGWTVMSPGQEVDLSNMFLTQTSVADYEDLCRLDVLGLEDTSTGDQGAVYSEFKEQLKRSPEGWYETGLPWKGNHPPLPNNEAGSLRRLSNLVRKLEKTDMLVKYDGVIQEQLAQGVVERVETQAEGREFYIPRKAVVRETAETTKLRIVYNASAKAHEKVPSLNDCLDTFRKSTVEGTGVGQIPSGRNRWRPEAGVPASENPRGGQGCPALPLAGGPEVKASGDIMFHKLCCSGWPHHHSCSSE